MHISCVNTIRNVIIDNNFLTHFTLSLIRNFNKLFSGPNRLLCRPQKQKLSSSFRMDSINVTTAHTTEMLPLFIDYRAPTFHLDIIKSTVRQGGNYSMCPKRFIVHKAGRIIDETLGRKQKFFDVSKHYPMLSKYS
jgi:hypothetical protein